MSENIKTLLDRAAEATFAAVDVDAVIGAGDRAVRRRRRGLAGAACAGALAIGALGVGLGAFGGGSERADGDRVASVSLPLDEVTWTWDGHLHTPDRSWALGFQVAAYVRTADGYAFVTPDGDVHASVGGHSERIGTTTGKRKRLVADEEGTLVGWIRVEDGRPRFVVHDLATGEEKVFGETVEGQAELADDADPAYFYAIDGRTAYVRDTRGAVAVDVDTGVVTVVDARARNGFSILGAEDGTIAFGDLDGDLKVGRSLADAVAIPGVWSSQARFSPDGRFVSVDGDEPLVYEVATGRRVPIDTDGRAFAAAYEWLGPDTVVLIASRSAEHGPFEVLTCTVPVGTCDLAVADLGIGGTADAERRVALPVGEETG